MRNGNLADLATMLEDQQARKYDLVVPSEAIHPFVRPAVGAQSGEETEPRFGLFIDGADFGGVDADGNPYSEGLIVWPMQQCHDGLAERLDIPAKYYRRMLTEAPDLLVDNVSYWLERSDEAHMLRTFRDSTGEALGRALLSPRYNAIDHLDMLWGILEGVRTACPTASISGCDLSEKRMRIRITAPEIAINIAELVQDYMPRGGLNDHGGPRTGEAFPLLFAGLVASNSETGNGAWSIAPRAVVEVCTNGLTREVDAIRRIHIGGRLDEGVIDWSADTRQAQIDLIRAQARDAVATFLSTEYLERFREDMAEAQGRQVRHAVRAVEHVRRTLSFTEEQGIAILEHFLGSGDSTALGLAQAITRQAQEVDDDLAYEAEASALAVAMTAAAVR